MVEITNWEVYDLKSSVIASRNAMRTTPPEYTDEEFKKSLDRAITLARAKSGSGHDNWLKGVRVSFDIKYPQYFTPELQRYNFLDIVTSASKMHRLMMMDVDKSCNKYVTRGAIYELRFHVDNYNRIKDNDNFKYAEFELRNGERITTTNKKEALYYAFMMCVSNCPMGFELFMRCSTNYLQLKTIYHQRKGHKLFEDWVVAFCKNFVEQLPYAQEFIIGLDKDEKK